MGERIAVVLLLACLVLCAGPAIAFRLIGSGEKWVRWDAAPRFVGGEERSLAGGLRYSIETGDYAAFRDRFSWVPEPPSAVAFESAIARAFEHWTIVDPASGLPAGFHFVADLATPAVDEPGIPGNPSSFLGVNAGAEIDIFAATPHPGEGFAASVIFFVDVVEDDLTLTSGTTDYPGFAITGVDIRINPAFVWSLRGFETLLAHEIGHALGLADLEAPTTPGDTSAFLDDDYDGTSSASALATLTNSFALVIDVFDPDASPLQAYSGDLNLDPGVDTAGVEILMESDDFLDLLAIEPKLQNDDFAGRQFLYPVPVPEPRYGVALVAGALAVTLWAVYRGHLSRGQPRGQQGRAG